MSSFSVNENSRCVKYVFGTATKYHKHLSVMGCNNMHVKGLHAAHIKCQCSGIWMNIKLLTHIWHKYLAEQAHRKHAATSPRYCEDQCPLVELPERGGGGGPLETPGLREYKGASKRPPEITRQIQYMIATYQSF